MPASTPMRGREREIETVRRAIADGTTRLVTLTGLPGVGKTRVVTEALDARRAGAPHKHEWIDAEGLGAASVRTALAVATARRPAVAEPDERRVGELPVVVVDGLDVGAEVREAVRDLLASAGVRLVVTSRMPLRLPGEHVVRVEPFPPAGTTDPAASAAHPGVRMFCDVAASVGRSVDADAVVDAAAIVDRLGGHPGAIEVVASRVVAMSPASILGLLRDGGVREVLTSRRAEDALPAAVAWSASLLDDDQRRLLTAMRVFAGPVTVDAVAAVADLELGDAIDQVSDLVDVHLLDADYGAQVSTFVLHPMVREFAPPIDDTGGATFDDAHRAWALGVAAAVDPSGPPDPAVELVERDLVALLDRSIAVARADDACRLVIALAPLWQQRGMSAAAAGSLAATVALADGTVADGTVADGVRALVTAWHALFRLEAAVLAGDVSGIASDRDTALTLARSSDEATLLAVLRLAVQMAIVLDDHDLARDLCADGIDLAERLDAERCRTQFEIWSGMLAHQAGRVDDAAAIGAAALARARRGGESDLVVTAAGLLLTLPRRAVAGIALPSMVELVEMAEDADDRRQLLWLRPAAAAEALRAGDRTTAARLTADQLDATRSPAERSWALVSLLNVVGLALLEGDLEIAARFDGAVSAHLPLLRRALPMQALADHERAVATLRGQLGEAAYRTAAGAGALVPLDAANGEALEYVQQVLERSADLGPVTRAAETALTTREREILDRLAAGDSNKQIAVRLGITPKTVMHHTSNIYRKLGVRGRGEAVATTIGGRDPAA